MNWTFGTCQNLCTRTLAISLTPCSAEFIHMEEDKPSNSDVSPFEDNTKRRETERWFL